MKSQPEAARRDRAQIRKRWYEEVERVRELPGFDRFLTASDYSLVEMSSSEIVTAVNISRFGSHALLVSRDGVTTVGLPALTVESAAKQAEIYEKVVLVGGNPRDARNRELLLLDMLAWLWDVVGAPVAEVLLSRGKSHISAGALQGLSESCQFMLLEYTD